MKKQKLDLKVSRQVNLNFFEELYDYELYYGKFSFN